MRRRDLYLALAVVACRVDRTDHVDDAKKPARVVEPSAAEPSAVEIAPFTALHVLDGTAGGVVALSHDKRRLAVTRHLGRQELWDLRTAERLGVLTDFGSPARAVDVAGDHVLTADQHGVKLWSAPALEHPRVLLPDGEDIRGLDLSRDGGTFLIHRGEQVYIGDSDDSSAPRMHDIGQWSAARLGEGGSVFVTENRRQWAVWAVGADKPTLEVPSESKLSPAGPRLLSQAASTCTLWDTISGRSVAEVSGRDGCRALGFSSDGSWALALDSDRTHVLDATTGAEILVVDGLAVAGRHAIAAIADGEVVVRGLPKGDELGRVPAGWYVGAVSPRGRYVFQVEDEHERVWDVTQGKAVAEFSSPRTSRGSIAHAVFDESEAEVVFFEDDSSAQAALFHLPDGREQARLGTDQWTNPTIAFSPGGEQLAIAGGDAVTLVAVADGRTRRCPSDRHLGFAHVVFVDDAHVLSADRIFSVAPGEPCRVAAEVQVADAATPVPLGDGTALILGKRGPDSVVQAVDSQGRTHDLFEGFGVDLAVGSDRRAVLGVMHGPPVLQGAPPLDAFESAVESDAVAVSPDGALIATAGYSGGLWLIDVGRWKVSGTIDLSLTGPPTLEFLGPRRVVAAGSDSLKVIDVDSKAVLFEAKEDQEPLAFAVEPRGRSLAVSSTGPCPTAGPGPCRQLRKHPVTLYDPTTFEAIAELDSHHDRVSDIAFAPSGELLASAGKDGRIVIWTLPPTDGGDK